MLPTTVSDLVFSARSGNRSVLMCVTEVCMFTSSSKTSFVSLLLLTQLLSVIRRECPRVSPDTLWGSGDNSGSATRGAAPPPASAGQHQLGLVHTAGLNSELEATRWSFLTLSLASNALPAQLSHTVPPRFSHTRGG